MTNKLTFLASDRNRKRTWACFSPRNLPKKIRPDPSTFHLVIVVTNRQTYAGDSIIPRESFRGDKNAAGIYRGTVRRATLLKIDPPISDCRDDVWCADEARTRC